MQIKLNWRLFKSETVRVSTFLTLCNVATLQRMFFFIHLFGSVLLLAMTHSKCFVTAEQNAAYAALMPQTSSIQVGISDCVFWKPKNLCVFFFQSHGHWFQAPKRTTVCHWLHQVICGLQGIELCQVVLKAAWTLQDVASVWDASRLDFYCKKKVEGDAARSCWTL